MIHKNIFNRSLIFLLSAVLMFVLAGCSVGQSKQNEEYVDSVKNLVNDSVNNTRVLNKIDKNFNYRDEKNAQDYISALETLSDIYQKLIKLNCTDEFEDLDSRISDEAASALSDISEIKSLVSYALEKDDDSMFQKNRDGLMSDYKTHYEKLTEISSEVQTRQRNG